LQEVNLCLHIGYVVEDAAYGGYSRFAGTIVNCYVSGRINFKNRDGLVEQLGQYYNTLFAEVIMVLKPENLTGNLLFIPVVAVGVPEYFFYDKVFINRWGGGGMGVGSVKSGGSTNFSFRLWCFRQLCRFCRRTGRTGRAPAERLGGLGGAAEEASDGSVFCKWMAFSDNTPVYPYCSSEKEGGFGRCSVVCVVDELPPGAAVLLPPSQRCDISQIRILDIEKAKFSKNGESAF